MSFGDRKIFLYYLADPATGNTYYVDSGGRVQLGSFTTLQNSPEGWLDNRVSFGRSASYYGIVRTFTVPLKFVGDGAKIIRYLFYNKRGVEQTLQLIILKWNPDTDVYELYYKGMVDLTKIDDQVAEGVNVSVMEGGVVQLLKAYENTVFQIPCDGSIPENIKVKLDGVLFKDTFHYQIAAVEDASDAESILPCIYTGNEGDNIGIIHGDGHYERTGGPDYYSTSANYIFSSSEPISVRISGKIKVSSNPGLVHLHLFAVTSNYNITNLVAVTNLPAGEYELPFDQTVNLNSFENLFIAFSPVAFAIDIIGGNFDLIFDSKYRTTETWAIKAWDLYRLILQNINQAASNSLQQFNYQAASQLLQQYQNLVVCSGDSLRAGNDPSYPGPVVVKTSLKDFFDSFNAILNASLSNQTLMGQKESLFFEAKEYVFDSSVITMELGEVSDFHVSVALDYFFTVSKIGYPNQQYEEKAGKYEYNTTAQWAAPVKSIPAKELPLVSKYRADSHGIEYTRFSSGGRSTTYNASDNSVFVLNVNASTTEYDQYQAMNNGPLSLPGAQNNQPAKLATVSGDFCSNNEEFTVFTFIQTLNQPQFTISLAVAGNTFGSGTLTFSIYLNGNQTGNQITVPGNASFGQTVSVPNLILSQGDTIEARYTTLPGLTASLGVVSLKVISEQILLYSLNRLNYDAISGIPNPNTYFNIEDLTPKRMLIRHGNYLRSPLFNLIPDNLEFQTLDRNQDLTTTLAGQTITEKAIVPISSLAFPLFYPFIFEFTTKVPMNFMALLSGAANGHIKFLYNGIEFFGFPLEVSQKPALNESQEWKLLCSPRTNVANLTDLDIDGLNYLEMAGLSSFVPFLCPVHFVPLGYVNDPKYHNLTMEQDWFKNRIKSWIAQNDYYNPWQNGDIIPLQMQTNGLGPVQVEILDCSGNVINTYELDVVITDAVKQPNLLYQVNVPLAGIPEGIYYMVITAGTGSAITRFVSEGLWIKPDWPETLLFEYSNKVNKQAMIFSNGYRGSFRVHGRIVRYEPGSKFAVYEDQPADIELLNGIPYDTFKLEIGYQNGGVPDYVIRKLNRIMLLTDTAIDGWYYTRNGDAKWERTNYPGQPKEFWSLDIRYSDNRDGITLSTDGTVDQNISIAYNIQANAFGDNGDPAYVIQVTQQNQ